MVDAADGRSSTLPRDEAVVHITTKPGGLVIRPVGPHLAEREVQRIREVVLPAIESAASLRAIVLDMREIRWMTSIGLGLCVDIRAAARDRRARSYIVGLNDELTRLFRMVRVHRSFRSLDSIDDVDRALAA